MAEMEARGSPVARDLRHHVERDGLHRRPAIAAMAALAVNRRHRREIVEIDGDDGRDGVDERHGIRSALLGGARRIADVGDVRRQLHDHRHARVLLAPARHHLDVLRHLADRRAHAAFAHAMRAAEVKLDAVAPVSSTFGRMAFQDCSVHGTMIETIMARSGHSRFTFLISWRFTSSGRSVMSSMLLRPRSLRSAPWIAP